MDERWQLIADIFLQVVEQDSAAGSLFIRNAACGDECVRREVAVFVASHEQAETLMEVPAVHVGDTRLPTSVTAGLTERCRLPLDSSSGCVSDAFERRTPLNDGRSRPDPDSIRKRRSQAQIVVQRAGCSRLHRSVSPDESARPRQEPDLPAASASRAGPSELQIQRVASPRNQPHGRRRRFSCSSRLTRLWRGCPRTVPKPLVLTCLELSLRAKADAPSC